MSGVTVEGTVSAWNRRRNYKRHAYRRKRSSGAEMVESGFTERRSRPLASTQRNPTRSVRPFVMIPHNAAHLQGRHDTKGVRYPAKLLGQVFKQESINNFFDVPAGYSPNYGSFGSGLGRARKRRTAMAVCAKLWRHGHRGNEEARYPGEVHTCLFASRLD